MKNLTPDQKYIKNLEDAIELHQNEKITAAELSVKLKKIIHIYITGDRRKRQHI